MLNDDAWLHLNAWVQECVYCPSAHSSHLPLHCRSALSKSQDLAAEMKGATDFKVFMALDAFVNQKESYQQDLLDFARHLEVGLFVRSGKEYKLV